MPLLKYLNLRRKDSNHNICMQAGKNENYEKEKWTWFISFVRKMTESWFLPRYFRLCPLWIKCQIVSKGFSTIKETVKTLQFTIWFTIFSKNLRFYKLKDNNLWFYQVFNLYPFESTHKNVLESKKQPQFLISLHI